jgi:NADH-quinone oxidoreductase subunit J
VAGVVMGGGLIAVLVATTVTGQPSVGGALSRNVPNVNQLARLLFTDYLFAFEITSALLVIAVVGAVVLARPRKGVDVDVDESSAADDLEEAAQ